MLEITANASQKIKEFSVLEPGKFFRLKLDSGGCSGFQYEVRFTEKVDDDVCYTQDGVTILIDPLSNSLLPNLRIDYVDTLAFSGFKFDNPDAISKCGCGLSFNL
jgi:iron-sulfur cluster assembly accessory protein